MKGAWAILVVIGCFLGLGNLAVDAYRNGFTWIHMACVCALCEEARRCVDEYEEYRQEKR